MSKSSRTNSERFISAYNSIDHSLRAIYGFKRSISFADLVRKAVTLNSVVRKYEDELIDYGRLRNSIVHKTNPNYVIAEPHDEVVEEFEKIAKLIATPPTAFDRICRKEVVTCQSELPLKDVIVIMEQTGYNNIPVYQGKNLIGVAVGQKILSSMADCIRRGEDVDVYLQNTKIAQVVTTAEDTSYFRVANKDLTIERALNYFYLNRKLALIILTENGTFMEEPIGIMTTADILDMNAVLENYS